MSNFFLLWQKKGLPVYSVILKEYISYEIVNQEAKPIFAKEREIQIISPFQEPDKMERQPYGIRVFPSLSGATSTPLKPQDILSFEGNGYTVWEVERQDVLGLFSFKAKFINQEE